MNIEAYNLDSLRKLVRTLQNENKSLKEKLHKANIPFAETNPFDEQIENIEEYDLDQGGRIISKNKISDDEIKHFYSMFWGRIDVYAKRANNGGYYPQCDNRWKSVCPKNRNENVRCSECENTKWT